MLLSPTLGLLQVPEELTVSQDLQATADQQDDTPTAAEVPALQDDGWDQQTGWDFQDVPLDSPRSSRLTGNSLKGSPVRSAAHAKQERSSPGQDNSQDMQLASLQTAHDALTRRLEHVETVRLELTLALVLLYSIAWLLCLHSNSQSTFRICCRCCILCITDDMRVSSVALSGIAAACTAPPVY